ncbi:DNA repair protein RAD5, SWI/SNF-related matrix-associated actin-dependent regulator of chromatin [Achlya hypogyna]|uniref:RanBP-type and C3HC4-type zinc finger-containing protein 1 n=1 Tax=Achlya hypogyna TaxID=1202772 RepID=A0A1V9ZG98_ACHHY|nr:DNA repair protein RAD5, SWI/SNF-related matrix-associated actin-dependent regulator of chromatin [Achlya hypogyna]
MDWACLNCSFENPAAATRCEICLSGRAGVAMFGSSKRPRETPAPTRGKKKTKAVKAAATPSSFFREDARMLEKKLTQMRECLGNSVSDDEMRLLLQKNAGSVSFAIAAYYEQAARQEATAATAASDEQHWTRTMGDSAYFLGTATADASITRREDRSIAVGARFLLQVEGASMVRVVTTTGNLVVGRMDEAWEELLATLLSERLVSVGATIAEAPFESAVFAKFQVQLFVFAAPAFWSALAAASAARDKAFVLLEYLGGAKRVVAPSATLALPGETFEKMADDATVDVLYRSSIAPGSAIGGYSASAVHGVLHNITLRSYQEEALRWMLFRELNEDSLSDSHLIGQALRLEHAGAKPGGPSTVHPLWASRTCSRGGQPVPYYVNVFERLASLQPPPPPVPCRGGILADDMGMGKTIMVLALVAARKSLYTADWAPAGSARRGKTLVVCPLSLLHQWKQEFEARAPRLSVALFYEGATRAGAALGADVVLTTYGVLSSDAQQSSPLHTVHWDRVILDEAHSIKNRSTAYFKSCAALRATHRWCLTGTPIQNSLEDILSLLVFLQYQPWDKTEWWTRVVAQPYEKGQQCALVRLQAILGPVLLRRTKATRDAATNELIVQLPPKRVAVVRLAFSVEERQFYKAVYTKSRGEFFGYVEGGNAMASYVAIFALLLRLRQACDHPFLVMGKGDVTRTLARKTTAAATATTNTDYFAELTAILQQSATTPDASTEDTYVKSRILEIQEEGLDCQECPVCLDVPQLPVLTPCAHLLCHECARAAIDASPVCPVCRADVAFAQLVPVAPPEKTDATPAGGGAGSAKLRQLVQDLDALRATEPHRKVVVFSQWTHMLELVQTTLSQHGFSHVRFDGSLKQEDRERVLNEFSRGDAQVLVISLKAGGVGLNLTAASVVILLDPWWNPALEDQAVDRVHRLGQESDVIVKKYVVEDTVEDMILQLQERKATMASTVLATAKPGSDSDGRLSLSDLLKFFR